MEEEVLQQIVYSIQSGMNNISEESREFRMEAEKQNYSITKFMEDLSSKFFITQNRQQSSMNESLNEVERQSNATNQNLNELEAAFQESVSVQNQMVFQLKDIANSIGSLVQLFQQASGQSSFSFGNMAGAGLGMLGGAAATAGIGAGLMSLVQAGSAGAEQIGGGGNGDGSLYSGEPISGSTEEILKTIRTLESNGDYTTPNKAGASSASGAYQFIDSTWQNLTQKYNIGTDFKRAMNAPPEIQDAVAAKYVEEILSQNNNDVSKVPLVWFTGNPQGKISEEAQSRNPTINPAGYQKKWLDIFNSNSGQGNQENSSQVTPVEADSDDKNQVSNSMGSLDGSGQLKDRKGFIIHHTGGRGDVGGVIDTLNQRGLSVQFVIDREGNIHQLLPSGAKGSHIKKGQGVGQGLSNSNTEGVEIIAKNDSDVLPVQVEAAKRLAAQLGYAPNQVYGHGEINPHKQKTEGSTAVSAIRGGQAPANPAETGSATGSTGLSGESGSSTAGGGNMNPFAGSPFEGMVSGLAGALSTLTGFGEAGAGFLSGGGMLGSMVGGLGSILPSLVSSLDSMNNKEYIEKETPSLANKELQTKNETKSDATMINASKEDPRVTSLSNSLSMEKTIAELNNQVPVKETRIENNIQRQPSMTTADHNIFSPTPSSSLSWVDQLAGRVAYKGLKIGGVYT
jgi:hypothetical protein